MDGGAAGGGGTGRSALTSRRLAEQPVQDARRDDAPVLGRRADVVDRVELGGERLGGAVGGLRRRRRALEDAPRSRAARIGVGRHRPERHADVAPDAARRPSRQASAMHDLADRLRPPRADLAEARPRGRRAAGSGCAAAARRARARSAGRPARSRVAGDDRARRAAPPSTNSASTASRTGSVSPAGEALATLPPIVPRFWIWAAPIVAAASTSAGQVLAAQRRAADLRVGRQRARARARRRRARSRAARRAATGRAIRVRRLGPSSPVSWTIRSVPPAIGRQAAPSASSA